MGCTSHNCILLYVDFFCGVLLGRAAVTYAAAVAEYVNVHLIASVVLLAACCAMFVEYANVLPVCASACCWLLCTECVN